jgi:flagellar basal-body rod modification protein FlgD
MGKEIVAEGDLLSLQQDKSAMGRFQLDEPADCIVQVIDANGHAVKRLDLGVLDSGEHTFTWDGRDEEGNMMGPGIYAFDISATNESGRAASVETQVTGEVSRVNLEGESPLLYIGTLPVALSQIIDVRDAGGS